MLLDAPKHLEIASYSTVDRDYRLEMAVTAGA